jgi:hypothetical protein
LQTGEGSLDESKVFEALKEADSRGTRIQAGGQNQALTLLVEDLTKQNQDLSSRDRAKLLASITQEYERRAGNKRKSDAGNVLQTAFHHCLRQFGTPATGEPEHIDDLELDNMVRTEQRKIGFSVKRTLRERYKQSLRRDSDTELDAVWFVTLDDGNLSENKVRDIDNDGGRLYLPAETDFWKSYGGQLDGLYMGSQLLSDLAQTCDLSLDRTGGK